MSKTKGVKLDESTRQRLEALARIRDRSPNWLMCRAIETYLDREEKYEQEKLEDMERWERYQLTGEAVSHEKAAEWLENLAQGKVTVWQPLNATLTSSSNLRIWSDVQFIFLTKKR